jgi:hypothetical protein
MDYHLGKYRLLEGSDGITFWTIDPWQDFDFPRRINKAERHVIMQKSELITPFYRWKERGFLVELLDKEIMDDVEMYVLSLTRPGMTPEKWYLNAETYLAYKTLTRWVDFATPTDAEIFYDDYRNVNGIKLPHYIENVYRTRQTITEIDKILINPVIDKSIFSMPACPHMEKIKRMAGSWNVQVEYMTRGGSWQVFDNVNCNFNFIPGNLLQGNIAYEFTFPVFTIFTINYSRRDQNFQMMVFDELYSTTDLYQGNFTDDILVFEKTGKDITIGEQNQPVMQFFFYFNEKDKIVMLKKRSTDRGKTWQDVERLTFSGAAK